MPLCIYCTGFIMTVFQRLDMHEQGSCWLACWFAGRIVAMRLLRSTKAPTQIAFVEFGDAESASAALDWSGSLLGMHAHCTTRTCRPESDQKVRLKC